MKSLIIAALLLSSTVAMADARSRAGNIRVANLMAFKKDALVQSSIDYAAKRTGIRAELCDLDVELNEAVLDMAKMEVTIICINTSENNEGQTNITIKGEVFEGQKNPLADRQFSVTSLAVEVAG